MVVTRTWAFVVGPVEKTKLPPVGPVGAVAAMVWNVAPPSRLSSIRTAVVDVRLLIVQETGMSGPSRTAPAAGAVTVNVVVMIVNVGLVPVAPVLFEVTRTRARLSGPVTFQVKLPVLGA